MSHPGINISSFLSELHQQNIRVEVDNERLKLHAPKGALTAELRERLKLHKADIIRFHREQVSEQHNPQSGIPYLDHTQPLPCSFAQQRLWLLDRLEPGSAAYNIPVSLNASGQLDITVFCQAVTEIIRRHESLRTVFCEPHANDHTSQQVILAPFKPDVIIDDLSTLSAAEAETCIRTQATQDLETPFDLATGPLLRLRIMQSSPRQHALLFTFHHIIFDGLSLAVFLRELNTLYQAYTQQQPSPLTELTVQYADFSAWQRDRLSGDKLEEQLAFWRNELAGAPPLLGLPIDRPRPAQQSYAGARQAFVIEKPTTQKLRMLSQQQGATLFMAFHTVLTMLLARYTGKDDIVIGTPIANRNNRQLEQLIGFFANTLVLRTTVTADSSFNDLLGQIKNRALQSYKHQELPFEKLVDELKIERSLSHNPLFQVMLSFQNAHTDSFSLPGVDISSLDFDYTLSRFDLSVIVREHQDTLSVIFEYSTALFDADTITRMMGHLDTLLEVATEQPAVPLAQLSMLTQQDRQQLRQWNATATGYPLDQTLIHLFETQVKQTPDNIALICGNEQLSYQQLNAKANQLAHHLLQHIDSPNSLIAICVERSPLMLVGLLAILKAGAAYVPVDPAYPQDRIQHMLGDSAVAIILTQQHLRNVLPVSTDTPHQLICLDDPDNTIFTAFPDTNPVSRSQPDDLAYVIYTSGSTGKPKGVMITQRNLSNFLQDMRQRTGIQSDDRLLAVTTLSFDIAALELYLPLISSSRLYLADHATTSDAQALQQQLDEHRISFMQATPATWQMLRHSDWQAVHPLNILCGGEAFPAELNPYLLANSQQLWNVYGPTETTIWSVTNLLENDSGNAPAIGKPLANTRIYILDKQHQQQPIGIPGELCIAGEGLAAGYLHQPDLTAQKFVQIEIAGQAERIYKTGDLARWLPDGTLECLGRLDHQVKIRGFRIELGEIEALLAQQSGVKQTLVVARATSSGEQQLVAYILRQEAVQQEVSSQQDSTYVAALKSALQQQLPAYMMPAFFVVLDEFPLLPNGKINRHALPQPDGVSTRSKAYMHPRNSLELQLSQIWENTLSISPISVFDNFFEIGGDSLLAIRLLSAINQNFGIQIPLNTLFHSGTIEQLALLLRRDTAARQDNSPLVTLQSAGNQPPIFCVHAAGGIVFRYMQLAKLMTTRYDHPFHGLQARGIEPGETPYVSIEEMAQDYVQAIRAHKPAGPYLLAGWSMGGTVAFEIARRLEAQGETVSGLIMIDAPSPYMDEYEADDVDFLLERLEPAAGINIQDEVEQQASAQAKKQLIMEQKKQLGLFPPDIKPAEAEQRLAVHKHHNRLLCQYQPASTITAGIAFIRALEETSFDEKMKDPVPAWATFTRNGIIEEEAPGNHFNMFSNEYSPILAEKLHACIQVLHNSIPNTNRTQ